MIFASQSCRKIRFAEILRHTTVVEKVSSLAENTNLQNFCIQRFQATRLRCRISVSQSCRKCKNLAENKICRISV